MVRVLSYNILLGGTRRLEQLTSVIQANHADVVGLAEATDPKVVAELARRLDMHSRMSGEGQHAHDWQVALLSRLPIHTVQVHTYPDIFTRRYLLEVELEEVDGSLFTAFVIHQTSSFHLRSQGNRIRRGEIAKIVEIMRSREGQPHLLMGDFNSIAPGDTLQASTILQNSLRHREQRRQRRQKESQLPPTPAPLYERLLISIFKGILDNKLGKTLVNRISLRYARGGIDLLLQAGYTDSFRHLHTDTLGYTFPAKGPACRIDYIFVSSQLAPRLKLCEVVTDGESVVQASDHLPVYADFSAKNSG